MKGFSFSVYIIIAACRAKHVECSLLQTAVRSEEAVCASVNPGICLRWHERVLVCGFTQICVHPNALGMTGAISGDGHHQGRDNREVLKA